MTPSAMTAQLPPVAPDVVAGAVESLTSRLRKKLDAAIEQYAAVTATTTADGIRIVCGEDAVVTLEPGPSGTLTDNDQARCSCLLSPRCLHRAAVLGGCPVADADAGPVLGDGGTAAGPAAPSPGPDTTVSVSVPVSVPANTDTGTDTETGTGTDVPGGAARSAADAAPRQAVTAAQSAAASGLWSSAAALLAAGVPAGGAVPQAELLRAAHTARLAGLHRAEAAALRVVRGLRGARERHDGHRLADLVAAFRDLLLTTALLTAAGEGPADPELIGTARRNYRSGGSLRVHGVCREPVISATGYGGVVTHLITDDGRWFTVSDVKPGGIARAVGAARAPVALGATVLDHEQLSRGALLVAGATISPDGRLGSGRGVRSSSVPALPWTAGPLAALFARPVADAVSERLSAGPGADPEQAGQARELVGCDLEISGSTGDHLLARELPRPGAVSPAGPLIRLVPAHSDPGLAHAANFRRLASRPGLRVRVIGRIDPDRAATLRPLAVGPVPGAEATLRLPPEWLDRADLGYDRLQGAHLPPAAACSPTGGGAGTGGADPLADSPLWRVRRLIELAVAGGRRAVAEPARANGSGGDAAMLRRTGFHHAADLTAALTAEADRRTRDVFGRLSDAEPDRYASAWLAASVHLTGTEQELVRASWSRTAAG